MHGTATLLPPVLPTALRALISRLPVAPPSKVFTVLGNRLLWPALTDLDWHPLVGRRYLIQVKDTGVSLRFTVTRHGFALDPRRDAADLTLSATARDFLLLLARREDPDTLFFSRRLVSEGDTELGLVVKNLLDSIDLDALLARLPAPLARGARRWMAV